jgi:dTDP-glucose pyrophosphorylase/predicted transcriptional regulator
MNIIDNITLNVSTSIKKAMEIIDTSEIKIALVVDDSKRLIGTITDGDIRRAILKGIALSNPVKDTMNHNFIYAEVGESREKILQLSRLNQVRHVPIVDKDFILVGIEDTSKLLTPSKRLNKVVLMVGGLGTRLRPLTNETPKPLLKVRNKPILEIILEGFTKYGFNDFIFSVNYKAEMIEEYFGDGKRFGVNIQYVHDQGRMGTAGSLSFIKKQLTEDFLVMNGDLLTNINFEHLTDFHFNNNSKATMCVREYDFQVPYGVVNVQEHDIVSIEEKPVHKFFVNAGIYMLNPSVLKYIPENSFFDMPTLFDILIQAKEKILPFPIREYWLDIGGIEEYKKASSEYSENFGN